MPRGSEVLLTPDFPHGTVEGFDRGCKGGACPAAIPCRDVRRRYLSDLDFRRLVDAGVPLDEIKSIDEAAARRDVEVERQRRLAERQGRQFVEPVAEPRAVPSVPVVEAAARPAKWRVARVWVSIDPAGVMHGPHESEQAAVAHVAAQFGPVEGSGTGVAGALAGEPEPEAPAEGEAAPTRQRRALRRFTEDEVAALRSAWERGASDAAIARELGRRHQSVAAKLRTLGLAANGTQFGRKGRAS